MQHGLMPSNVYILTYDNEVLVSNRSLLTLMYMNHTLQQITFGATN